MNTKRLIELLECHVTSGFVKKIPSPLQGGLVIYDYEMKAQFEKFWPEEVRMARGLVVANGEEIVGRPIPKFFNLGELPESQAQNLPDEVPELSEKMDGSLIIVWKNPFNQFWTASTRGSFNSPQAVEANRWLRRDWEKIKGFFKEGWTYLFEYTGPDNQIVVFYDKPQFNYITRVNNQTGKDISYDEAWEDVIGYGIPPIPFMRKRVTSIDLHDKSVKNKEGYVARFSNGYRVKLKYTQYMLMHRIATGMSERAIWEGLMTGHQKFDMSNIPDEFKAWYDEKVRGFQDAYDAVYEEASAWIEKNVGEGIKPPEYRRSVQWRAFKSRVARDAAGLSPLVKAVVFSMIEGNDWPAIIWKSLEPKNAKTKFQEQNMEPSV